MSENTIATVTLPGGKTVPALGQGTWYLGESPASRAGEIEALRWGVNHGMTLIDTAEMYGEGLSEEMIGEAIRPLKRDELFLVSKVYPHNAGRSRIFRSCEQSLKRLGTDYLDLYLLHWRGSVPLAETVDCMQQLVKEGKILHWGVSNFDKADMEELWATPGGKSCATNQVLYHLASRGVEYDLLPWLRERGLPMMAYCPLAQAGRLKRNLLQSPVLGTIANNHNITVPQLLLAFVLHQPGVIAIPRAAQLHHMQQNRAAADVRLTSEELAALNEAFPAPTRPTPLDIV